MIRTVRTVARPSKTSVPSRSCHGGPSSGGEGVVHVDGLAPPSARLRGRIVVFGHLLSLPLSEVVARAAGRNRGAARSVHIANLDQFDVGAGGTVAG